VNSNNATELIKLGKAGGHDDPKSQETYLIEAPVLPSRKGEVYEKSCADLPVDVFFSYPQPFLIGLAFFVRCG
jgi:hypothetical protein